MRRPVVVGHSWGTLVALPLALDHPEAVSGLVLLSGYYHPTLRADVPLFSIPAIPFIGDLIRYTVGPFCVLLGGSTGPVPAYNSNGLWLRSPAEVASEAVELREEGGFKGLKLRLGRERLADDLATIEAVREAVGSEMSLMVDFNQGLHLGEALERCHAIDDLGLAWIEEPIAYDNLEGYARLTADLKTPVQIGENFYGPRALYTALQMKACDYVMADFMRIGGVTGWQRAAAIAAAAGIPISTHLYPEVAAHVMRVSETAHWLEWQDWANPILQQPYAVKDGNLHITDVPGVGLEWDEKAVDAHLGDNF
jgi:mandelate racemase